MLCRGSNIRVEVLEAFPQIGTDKIDLNLKFYEIFHPSRRIKCVSNDLIVTDYWNGWACFTCSIIVIGILTGYIGDLASHFGCTIGLKDSVTAITFVALGTSVPGEFYFIYITGVQPIGRVPHTGM